VRRVSGAPHLDHLTQSSRGPRAVSPRPARCCAWPRGADRGRRACPPRGPRGSAWRASARRAGPGRPGAGLPAAL